MIDKIEIKTPNLFINVNFSLKIITDNRVLKRTIPILFIPNTKALFRLKDLIATSRK
jgi:hypothetical protein